MNMDHGKTGESGQPAAPPVGLGSASKSWRGLVLLPDLEAGPATENPQKERLAKLLIVQVRSLSIQLTALV